MKTTILVCSMLFFGIAAVNGQVPNKWQDTNGDGFYDIDEFSNVYSKGYNDLDIDRDGRMNAKEFYDSNYNNLDVNRDGKLTNEEWTSGRNSYGEYITTDRYSQNPPQYLSRSEFEERFKETKYYSSYDKNNDGFITSEELNLTTYNRLDKNGDGKLDASELEGFQ
jgi:Ca2+-binding EF-hand superfamily protein